MAYSDVTNYPIPVGNSAGTLYVRLKAAGGVPAGIAATAAILAVLTAAPTITSFSPTFGAKGSTVVITGTKFTGATVVSVSSGAVASFTVNSDTQITAVLTTSQVTGKIKVTTPGGTATSTTDFTITSSATLPYMAGQLSDSLGVYRGEGTANNLDQTTSTWFFTQSRLATGGYNDTYVHHGYPGADAIDMLTPGYSATNNNEYTTGREIGSMSPIQYFMSKFPANKIPVVILAFGANNGAGRTPSQLLADILSLHDAIHNIRPDAITIAAQIYNRRDGSFAANGIPGRSSINAGLRASVGSRCQDYVDISSVPQISADDAPFNNKYYWNPDSVSNLSYVHRTTAGNKIVGQLNYAPVLAIQMGLTLPPLASETTVSTGESFEQDDSRISYVYTTMFDPNSVNAQYSKGTGGALLIDGSGSPVYAQVTLTSLGLGLFTPRSFYGTHDVRLQVGDLVNGQFVNVQEVDAGYSYSTASGENSDPLTEIVSVVFATSATRTYRIIAGPNSIPNEYLFVDLLKTPNSDGTFSATPPNSQTPQAGNPVPALLSAINGGVTVNGNSYTANAGIVQFSGVCVSTKKLVGPGVLRWVPSAVMDGTFFGIALMRTPTGRWQDEQTVGVYGDNANALDLWNFANKLGSSSQDMIGRMIDFVITDTGSSSTYTCQVQKNGANVGNSFPIPKGSYGLVTSASVGSAGSAYYIAGDLQ